MTGDGSLGDDSDGDRHRRSADGRSLPVTERLTGERLIGSIRRECLDHIIIGNERGLRRVLHAYVEHYLKSRTYLSLKKDVPVPGPVASPSDGNVVAIPRLGGLHHRYERRAA
jgi:putative transposase